MTTFSDGRDFGLVAGTPAPFTTYADGAAVLQSGGITLGADLPTMAVTPGATINAAVEFDGDIDLYTVDLVAGQTYSFSLIGAGATPLFDPLLTLSLNGVVIATDDDGGVGITSFITFTASQTGTYEIAAAAYPNPPMSGGYGPTGNYTFSVRQMGTDAAGGTDGTAAPASADGTTLGFIETGGDVDVYAVTLTAGTYYTFGVAGGIDYATIGGPFAPGEIDPSLTVRGPDGQLIAFSQDFSDDDLSAGVAFLAEESGTYYLSVAATGPQTGGYVLQSDSIDVSALDPLDTIDWGTQLPSTVVTVYFALAGEEYDGFVSLGWTEYEIGQAMEALQTYAAISNLTFSITDDPLNATFRLVTTETDEFLGMFHPPGQPSEGIGVFDKDNPGWQTPGGLEPGGAAFGTMVHEFGHGLGLAHPHDNGGSSSILPGVYFPYNSYGAFDLSQGIYTTMSYNWGWELNPAGENSGSPFFGGHSGPGAFDIAVMQAKYGASEHNIGDNVYVLPTGNAAGTFYVAIWDTGGNDTIAHGGTLTAHIDLTAATLDYSATGGGVVSYAQGIFGGFTIANGVVIENATGGSGADQIAGNDSNNVLSGGLGADTLTGRGGADTFKGSAAELNGDTITDLELGDAIVISDASLASFQYSLSGDTLTFTGGTLTLGEDITGYLVASAAAGGGVQLTLSNTPPPPPPPAITRAKLILTESGQDVSIGGNVAVFGTTAGGEVIEVVRGDVTLDASFNAGGDTVVLPDDAGSYTATLVGSFVVIESGDLRVSIPVGLAGMAVQFADSTRTLQIDGGQVMLGDQQITSNETAVQSSGPALTDPAETGPDSFAKLILGLPGQDLDVGGNVNVFGTASGGEVITVLGGTVRLDASFNAGGDTVVLPGSVEDYGATLSGSFVTITDGDTSVAIPVGIAGMTVAFDDASLTLVINTTNGTVELGGQVVPSSGQGDWDYLVDSDKGDALDAAMAPMPAAEAHDLGFERIDITDHFTFG